MFTWMVRRLFQACFVVLAMTVIVFVGVHVIGNPVDILISPEADQAERARIIANLGLDQPLWRQYLYFLNDAVHGNLGRSFVFTTNGLTTLDRLGRTTDALYLGGQVFLPPWTRHADANPRPVATDRVMNGLIGCISADGRWLLATASDRIDAPQQIVPE